MRRVAYRLGCLIILLLVFPALGGTYALKDGRTASGEPISFNETGVVLKEGEAAPQPRINYELFTQEGLKQLRADAKNPRDAGFVEPFIEEVAAAKREAQQIPIKPPPKVERPTGRTGIFTLFSSPVGLFLFAVLYGANLFAAREVALYKNHPFSKVIGAAAIAPFIAPIVFLVLPGKPAPVVDTVKTDATGTGATAAASAATAPPPSSPATPITSAPPAAQPGAPAYTMVETGGPNRGGITSRMMKKVTTMLGAEPAEPEPAQPSFPPPTVYTRGQFTFNRRFFETKMPGFFRVVPNDAEKDLVLYVKSTRGEFVGKRIPRITQTELYLQVFKGDATADEMIPFTEIHEVQVRHKDQP
jgi:hypothetical protein